MEHLANSIANWLDLLITAVKALPLILLGCILFGVIVYLGCWAWDKIRGAYLFRWSFKIRTKSVSPWNNQGIPRDLPEDTKMLMRLDTKSGIWMFHKTYAGASWFERLRARE